MSDVAPGLMGKTRASLIRLKDSESSSGKWRNQICMIGLTNWCNICWKGKEAFDATKDEDLFKISRSSCPILSLIMRSKAASCHEAGILIIVII